MVEISTRAGYRDWLLAARRSCRALLRSNGSIAIGIFFPGPYENADMIISRENLERLLESL